MGIEIIKIFEKNIQYFVNTIGKRTKRCKNNKKIHTYNMNMTFEKLLFALENTSSAKNIAILLENYCYLLLDFFVLVFICNFLRYILKK